MIESGHKLPEDFISKEGNAELDEGRTEKPKLIFSPEIKIQKAEEPKKEISDWFNTTLEWQEGVHYTVEAVEKDTFKEELMKLIPVTLIPEKLEQEVILESIPLKREVVNPRVRVMEGFLKDQKKKHIPQEGVQSLFLSQLEDKYRNYPARSEIYAETKTARTNA